MEKKKFKINVFDIVIVLVVLAIAVVGYRYANREVAQVTVPIRYTFELIDNPEGFTDLVKVGDDITDNVKNYYMGKVVAVEKLDYKYLVDDTVNVMVKDTVVPERETTLITVEANATESAGDFKVNGYFIVKAGLEVAVKGNGYAGRGYILNVER